MRHSLIFSLFILGFSSLIGQVIILRELMISFYGNEFFLGLVLAAWLGWVGLGSYWLAKMFKEEFPLKALLGCHILVALFLPILICLIRFAKTLIPVAGQMPDLLPALILAIFIPAPLCLILGLQFTLSPRLALGQNQGLPFREYSSGIHLLIRTRMERAALDFALGLASTTVSQAYLIEAIGFVIAGLFFSYFLVLFNVWIAVAILGCLNCLAVCLFQEAASTKIIGLSLIFIFALFSFPQINQPLNQKTQDWQFPGQKLIKTINSPYGQIAVSKFDQQYNFYETGLLLASNQENPFNESLAHFPLLQHPQPKNILLIGQGFSGLLNQILKHQPEKIFYLELDPWLIKATYAYLPAHFQEALKDPRVKIINTDGRYFIKTTQEKFDLVIINLPDPSTALLNRFYTQEFFEEIKKRLQPDGILATYLSFSPNYQNKDLVKLNASIYQTTKKVFPYLMIMPEEATLLFLASSENILTNQSEILTQRWQQRNLETKFISPDYLNYILTNDRLEPLNKILTQESVRINRDSWPISYAYNFLFWATYFHPQLADFLRNFLKIDFWWVMIGFLLALAVILIFRKKISQKTMSLRGTSTSPSLSTGSASDKAIPSASPRAALAKQGCPRASAWDCFVAPFARSGEKEEVAMTNRILWSAMAVAGFSLMAVEILLIFAFQNFYGYLYYRLALLMAAFMLGLAGGAWLGNKKIKEKAIQLFSVVKIHLAIIAYSLLIGLLFFFWPEISEKINWFLFRDILFPILAIIIGWLIGLEFAYANHLYAQTQQKKPFHTGFIYSADLFGSCLGALLAALLLIPLLGIFQTLLVLAMANFLIILLLQRLRL